MKYKLILTVLIALCFALGLGFAQDHNHSDSSSDHSTHDSSEGHAEHGDDSDKDHHHGEHSDDHNDDGHGHAEHGDDSMVMMKADTQNTFMIADQQIMLDPIVLADGSFQLGLRLSSMMHAEHNGMTMEKSDESSMESSEDSMSDMDTGHAMMMPALNVVTPSGETVTPMMMHGDMMEVMTFPVGMIEAGLYRVSIMMGEDMIEVPVGAYMANSEMTDAYLILTPNPSLSNRGQGQTFLYAFREGEAVHDDLSLQRSMAGMQHMTDTEELSFSHTHFDDLYNDVVGAKPMSNELVLSFAMAGNWDVNVAVMGEMQESLSFSVTVLDE